MSRFWVVLHESPWGISGEAVWRNTVTSGLEVLQGRRTNIHSNSEIANLCSRLEG